MVPRLIYIHRNSPEATQKKSYHALFAFWWIADITCFFLFLAFEHAQDIRESNWDQERLYPFWIGHSGFFEFKSVGFPIFVHRLDAKTLPVQYIRSVRFRECRRPLPSLLRIPCPSSVRHSS